MLENVPKPEFRYRFYVLSFGLAALIASASGVELYSVR